MDDVGAIVVLADLPGWERTLEDQGWTLWPEGRAPGKPRVLAMLLAQDRGKLVASVVGPAEHVRALAKTADNTWTVKELRADDGAAATAVKAVLPDPRRAPVNPDGSIGEKTGERYAVRRTFAGKDLDKAIEDAKPDDVREAKAEEGRRG